MLKNSAKFVGGFLLALSLALAGCTFQGEVEHRVVLDDVQGQTVQVKEQEEPQRVIIENENRSEKADVELKITRVSQDAATILVRIEDESGDLLAEEEIVVGEDNETEAGGEAVGEDNETETDDETAGNETGDEGDGNETDDGADGNETEDLESGASEPTIVVIQDIDIKGKDNIVVINQAIEGEADVEVKAKTSSDDVIEPVPDDNSTSEP